MTGFQRAISDAISLPKFAGVSGVGMAPSVSSLLFSSGELGL
jgi:hypothetical protein